MRAEHTADLRVPYEAVDLAAWLRGLGDADYQATSRGHLALGVPRGNEDLVTVESVGGTFIVNRHVVEEARRDYFRARSRRSRAWAMRIVPLVLDVTWEMRVRPAGPAASRLTCTLTTRVGNPVLDRVAGRSPAALVLGHHVREELAGFVDDLARKAREAA